MGNGFEIIDELNERWKEWHDRFDPGVGWRDVAQSMGFLEELDGSSVDFIEAWPAELRDMVVGLIASASQSGAALRFAWVPGYAFEARVVKANRDPKGIAEYTVVLTSPDPGEVLRGRAAEA